MTEERQMAIHYWEKALVDIFKQETPVTWETKNLNKMRAILKRICSDGSRCHFFLPGGGGTDLFDVEDSSRNYLLNIASETTRFIFSPLAMEFERCGDLANWSYFRIVANEIKSLNGSPCAEPYEEVTILPDGSFTDISIYHNGNFGFTENGKEIPLSYKAVRGVRYCRGTFIFVNKYSLMNSRGDNFDLYSGNHNLMNREDFRTFIQKMSSRRMTHL